MSECRTLESKHDCPRKCGICGNTTCNIFFDVLKFCLFLNINCLSTPDKLIDSFSFLVPFSYSTIQFFVDPNRTSTFRGVNASKTTMKSSTAKSTSTFSTGKAQRHNLINDGFSKIPINTD